jgi:hypothetical protein
MGHCAHVALPLTNDGSLLTKALGLEPRKSVCVLLLCAFDTPPLPILAFSAFQRIRGRCCPCEAPGLRILAATPHRSALSTMEGMESARYMVYHRPVTHI